MLQRLLAVLVLGLPALSASGCDAARSASFRFEVRDAVSEEPIPGARVRMFWFDGPGDVLGRGPVETRADEVGEERRHQSSYGLTQHDWTKARTDSSGTARMYGLTFYAGALLLPLRDLLAGAREEDPTGLWMRVRRSGDPSIPFQDFLIVRGDDGPRPVRIRDADGRPEAGEQAGTVTRIDIAGEPEYSWRVVLLLDR